MSIYNPDHDYKVTIFDNQDRMAKKQFVAVNCVRFDVTLGTETIVPGKYLMVLETKGSYIPTQIRDERTGQERAVRQQWMPRFQIQVHEDVSAKNGIRNVGPIPGGAVLLDKPAPLKSDLLADAKKAVLSEETKEALKEEDEVQPEVGPYDGKLMPELRSLCSNRKLTFNQKSTREDLVKILTEADKKASDAEE